MGGQNPGLTSEADVSEQDGMEATSEEARQIWLQQMLKRGVDLLAGNQAAQAEQILRRVVQAAPGFAFAIRLLGDALRETGQLKEAEACYRNALSINPQTPRAHRGLAFNFMALGDLAQAEREVNQTLAEDADDWPVLLALGNAQHKSLQLDEAIATFRRISSRHARGHAMALANIGVVHRDAGRIDQALNAYRAALEFAPGFSEIRRNLTVLLYATGESEEALVEARIWLELAPNDAVAAHMVASLSGEAAPETASADYLRTMFNSQAPIFDQALSRVGYQAPAIIAEEVRKATNGAVIAAALDIGCGTGLVAVELRQQITHLTGIDLAPRMIDQAKARGIYDQLDLADALEFMACHPNRFDLITAGDVLIYVGETNPWTQGFATCLSQGGLVVFNVETHEEPIPWRLLPSGRYSHAVAPFCAGLQAAGLTILARRPFTIRLERGQPVAGAVIVAERRA